MYTGRDKTVSTVDPGQDLELRLVACRSCGMRFLDNDDYDLDRVHDLYWKMMLRNVPEGHSVEVETLRRYLGCNLESFRTSGNMLEIGCGEGEFLKEAAKAGWNVTGVEVSETAAGIAREKHGLRVFTGTLEQHQDKMGQGAFDVVVMWGLIEHLRDPAALLGTVRRLVREGGAVLLYAPNADSVFYRLARLAMRITFGLVKAPMECVIIAMHPMYFTRRTLGQLLRNGGFAVTATEMTDIDLNLVFQFYRNTWWSNGLLHAAARALQLSTRLVPGWKSHMIVLATATGDQRGVGGS